MLRVSFKWEVVRFCVKNKSVLWIKNYFEVICMHIYLAIMLINDNMYIRTFNGLYLEENTFDYLNKLMYKI